MNKPTAVADAVGEARLTTELSEALDEITQLQALDDDWDLDGAHRINDEAVRLACRLLRSVEQLVRQEAVAWQAPEIGPVPDGSIALTWEGAHRQALMVFRSGESTAVECVTQEDGSPPARQVVAEAEAARLALWALSEK